MAATPWEMPGLDALQESVRRAASSERASTPVRRPGSRIRRRTELIAAAAFALAVVASLPARTGSLPAGTSLPVAAAATTESAASAASGIRAAVESSGLVAAATSQPGQSQAPGDAVAVLDLPAANLSSDTAHAAATDPAATAPAATAPATALAATAPRVKPAVVPVPGASATPAPAPRPADVPGTYKRDLYDGSLVRYQNPDGTACTAAATEVMLNFVAGRGTPGAGFDWTPTVSYAKQETILAWERANDTLDAGAPGSDPHGWRNALNYFGWQDFKNPATRHYEDLAYTSYAAAVRAAVVAIATENQPVGILAWAGGHAEIMTGYEVYGLDPAVSSDFVVQAVYITDPLAGDRVLDTRISYSAFQSGSTVYRFQPYDWSDSGADDPYMPGDTPSYTEWLGKWVIVAPVSVWAASPGAGR